MPASGLNLRQRFTLWFWDGTRDLEVTGTGPASLAGQLGLLEGGPYVRDNVAEKAAAAILERRPRCPIWITRETLELRERPRGRVAPTPENPGGYGPSVVDHVWNSQGIVWQNPDGDFPPAPEVQG